MNSDDESAAATPFVDNHMELYVPHNDLKENNIYHNRSITTMRAQSIQSLDMLGPPPTSPKENSRLTRYYHNNFKASKLRSLRNLYLIEQQLAIANITLVMSIIYAILLVTLGIIIHTRDTSTNQSSIYSICLCSVGYVYLLYLMIDISKYNCNGLNNQWKESYEEGLASLETTGNGSPVFTNPEPPRDLIPLKHHYCFSQGRHAESFYLKLGAVGFAIGHLVHSVLQITVQLGFIFDENVDNDDCLNLLVVVLDFMLPCYCIVQLYFMFKYSNVIILKSKCLAYFAFMHMIGSSLCFWVLAIARETTLILTIYAYTAYGNESNVSQKYSDKEISKGSLIDIENLYRENCTGSPALSTILGCLSPYLFPFTVEFNILVVAVYYIIWSNIGNYENYNKYLESNCNRDYSYRVSKTNEDASSNIVIHADCSKSVRGLFAGIILLVIVIGALIIGFVLGSVGGIYQKAGYVLNEVLKLGLHSSMLIAVVIAFKKLKKLDINQHPMSLLDDVLLYICLPAFFMETMLSMIATTNIVNVVKCIDVIVMVVQVVIQTPLIIDALRRCSNSKKLRRSKPGRELLMFLLIANVCMWFFNTFSYKSPESLDERYEYYGKVLWTVLGHMSLPLIMFYRFHSSVCLADIWDSAYKPGSVH